MLFKWKGVDVNLGEGLQEEKILVYQRPSKYNKNHKGPITQIGCWGYDDCGNGSNGVIEKETCLWVKDPFGLFKDFEPKKNPNN